MGCGTSVPLDIDVQTDIVVSDSVNGTPDSQPTHTNTTYTTDNNGIAIFNDINRIDPFTQLKSEYLYTAGQVKKLFFEVAEILKERKSKNILIEIFNDCKIVDNLCAYVGEQFYFPPEVFQTNFDGNGWVCLKPNLELGEINTLAVKSPTGIQVDWNWVSTHGRKLRYELSFEWDLRHMRFIIISTFYNSKIYNGKDMKMDLDFESPSFPCVIGVEVNLERSLPSMKVYANGVLLVQFKIPVHRKEFSTFKITEDMFSDCKEINFFLGARIRELGALWYA